MPYKCCVPKCKGNFVSGTSVSVFSFPKDEELKKAWAKAVGRNNYIPTPSSRVCELHFREHQIQRVVTVYDERNNRTLSAPLTHPRLYYGAVPCLIGSQLRAKRTLESPKQKVVENAKRRSTRPGKQPSTEAEQGDLEVGEISDEVIGNSGFDNIREFISKLHNINIADEWVVRKKEKCVKFILVNDVPIPHILCYGCFCENLHFSLFCEDIEIRSLRGLRFPMLCSSIYEVEIILNKASLEFLEQNENET